jgi:transposase-like protein
MECPQCCATKKQYKAGFNPSGSQRYRCGECNRVYTPEPKPRGYPTEMHMLVMRLYLEGNSQRAIGRILKIGQQTVANWVEAYVDKLPPASMPEQPQEAELDELYTFLQKKKTKSTSQRS